jgi:RimJ/RimL family protein N-acetyltransferase
VELVRRPAPYRIETERLVLRCPELMDLDTVHEVVSVSVDALRPWMPWVEPEPISKEQRANDVRRLRARFDQDEDYTYFVFAGDGPMVGGMGLHPRVGPGGVELGYWIRPSEQRQGLAVEGASALIRAAFECIGVDRVEIRIEPTNGPSRRVVEKLGVRKEATLRRRLPREEELRDVDLYTLFAADFSGSFPASVPARFLDALGQPWKT